MIRFGRVHEHIGSSDGALRQFVDLCCRWEVGRLCRITLRITRAGRRKGGDTVWCVVGFGNKTKAG